MIQIIKRLETYVRNSGGLASHGAAAARHFFTPRTRKAAIAVMIGILSVWTIVTVVSRMRAESRNRTVDICLDLDEIVSYCQLHAYPLADFAERCRAIGVTSLALSEESISTLASNGKIVFFPGQDFARLRLLDLVPAGSMIDANSLVTTDKALAETIALQLKARYGLDVTVRQAGKYRVLVPSFATPIVPRFWNENLLIGFNPAETEFAESHGFRLVARPENMGDPQWLESALHPPVSGVIWEGREVSGYPGRVDQVAHRIRENGLKLISMEFCSPGGIETLRASASNQLILGHDISVPELNRVAAPAFWTRRWLRAARERGVRFMLFHFWEGKAVEENLSYLRMTAQALKNEGFALGAAREPDYPNRGHHRIWLQLVACTGIVVPLLALASGKKHTRAIVAFGVTNAVTIAGALFISALLYDVFYMQKILEFPAVKLTMLAPLVLSVFLLYPPEKIRKLWRSPLEIRHLMIGVAVLAAILVLLARSGNGAAEWLKGDAGIRQWLEDIFVVRPRTKEFLIGQPLLFLGFYYRQPALVLVGMVGQVSIINTFLHAHTPLALSLVRTMHGLWLGLLIGYLAALSYNAAKKRLDR